MLRSGAGAQALVGEREKGVMLGESITPRIHTGDQAKKEMLPISQKARRRIGRTYFT